jgi:hypothetical protein
LCAKLTCPVCVGVTELSELALDLPYLLLEFAALLNELSAAWVVVAGTEIYEVPRLSRRTPELSLNCVELFAYFSQFPDAFLSFRVVLGQLSKPDT